MTIGLISKATLLATLLAILLNCRLCASPQQDDPAAFPATERVPAQRLAEVVQRGFVASHDGWSSDEVLVRDDLNQAFIAQCQLELPQLSPRDFNWAMLNLRKAKQLGGTITRRNRNSHDNYRHAAEIAARGMEDKYGKNIDRVLCDLELRGV